jgi:hypothetical protein
MEAMCWPAGLPGGHGTQQGGITVKGRNIALTCTLAIGLFAASALGVAAQGAADPMAPSFFTATPNDWVQDPGVTERREDGAVVGTGEGFTVSLDANDPRISGTATMVMNETDYREGARTLAPTGDAGSIRTLLVRIVNEDGSWEGPLQFLVLDDPEFSDASGWLTGSGAYEGLSAYIAWPEILSGGGFHGHITAEGPPPTPELPAE